MKKRKRPLAEIIARLLIHERPKQVFEISSDGNKKLVGYELDIAIVGDSLREQEGVKYEEIALMQAGGKFLLVKDACKKYKLSPRTVQRLCREKIIYCEKKSGRWFVLEKSIKDYVRN